MRVLGGIESFGRGRGVKSIAKDMGIDSGGEAWGDASAALGINNRKGLGGIRHIDLGRLRIQRTAA